jgi:hypothetical protein
MEYLPKGNALAAKYLKGEISELKAELAKYDKGTRKYLFQGIEETFLGNILLPQNEPAKQRAKKAQRGILEIKQSKKRLESVFEKMGALFNYYEQSRQQAYMQLKQNFEARMGGIKQAAEQQLGTKVAINVELQPQFQEEWRKYLAQLNSQYEPLLAEQKQEIQSLP